MTSSSKIQSEFDELKKLEAAEESLDTMLQKIQEEVAKTDVEWMHLRSLVGQKSASSTQTRVKPPEKPQTKKSFEIDDLSVNQTKLNLSLKASNFGESEEESD